MFNFLPDLHLRGPQMRRVRFLAVVALQVLNKEFDNEVLGKLYFVEHLLLDRRLHLEPFAMRLCPDETCIDDLRSLLQASDVLQAVSQHLR